MSDRFKLDRWSLFVEFDSYAEQFADGCGGDPLGELASLEAFVLREFEGLPEEFAEITRTHDDGRVEFTGEMPFMRELLHWIAMNTIPREVRLTRNEERAPWSGT